MEVGKKLKTLRLDRDISIYQISKVSDIAQNHVSSIEAGKVTPRVDTVEKIVEVLGCTMAEFFNEDADVFYLSDVEKTLVTQYRSLTKEQQHILLELISVLFQSKFKST